MIDDGLNFRDLIIRVAEEAGVASMPTTAGGKIDIPSDVHELDRIKRAINDGIDEIMRANPRWNCLRRFVSQTCPSTAGAQNVEGSAGRIRIPMSWRLVPQGRWTVRATSGSPEGACRLVQRSLEEVAALQATNQTIVSGQMPGIFAVGPLDIEDAGGVRRGNELRLWPVPSVDVVVEGWVRVRVAKLVELSDFSPMGCEHDRLIVRYAGMILKRTNPDMALRAWHQQDAAVALEESKALDKELTDRAPMRSEDGSESGDDIVPYRGEQVYVNGTLMSSAA